MIKTRIKWIDKKSEIGWLYVERPDSEVAFPIQKDELQAIRDVCQEHLDKFAKEKND